MSLALLFHYLLLNMFRMLIHPSSGACDLFVELFHGLYCSGSMCVGVTLWFGWGGVVSGCRLKQCFSLHPYLHFFLWPRRWMGVGGRHTSPRLIGPRKRGPVPILQELCGLQGRSGWLRKILPSPGFYPWTVQPAMSRYTDYAILAHWRATLSVIKL